MEKPRNFFGYIRISSHDQNIARQLIAMQKQDIPQEQLFIDRQSGKDFARPMYQKMLKQLHRNDTLYITSIDRLGRNYTEIIEQWHFLIHKKGIEIVVLDMPLLNTKYYKDLLGTFISDVVLQILSFVAEHERLNIKTRQAEGIAAAKAKGKRFGRPPKPLPKNFDTICQKWKNGEITGTLAAKCCCMPLSTFRYKAKSYDKLQ